MTIATKNMNKKAQEEIFGFMIIVVMIIIIGLVFLAFYKPGAKEQEKYIGTKVNNLLYSALAYNADSISIESMIEDCNSGGEQACADIEIRLKDIIQTALEKGSLGIGRQTKGYSFSAGTVEFAEGNTTGNMIGSSIPISSDIEAKLRIFY